MPGYNIQSSGAAFSNSLEDYMVRKAASERQAMLDKQDLKEAQELAKYRQDQLSLKRDELKGEQEDRKIRTAERQEEMGQKRVAKAEKTRAEMQPGDVMTPEMLAEQESLDPAGAAQFFPKPPTSLPGVAAVSLGRTPMTRPGPLGIPEQQGITPSTAADVRPFLGTGPQRAAVQTREDAQAARVAQDQEAAELRRELADQADLTRRELAAESNQTRRDIAASRESTDVALDLTPQSLDMAAMMYAKTGQLPPMGMGKAGAGARARILNRAAQFDSHAGTFTSTEPPDIAVAKAGFSADQGAMNQLQKNLSAVSAFTGAAEKNAVLFDTLLKKVPETGSALLNKPIRAIETAIGNENMAAFNALRQSLNNEYARIISNPNLVGVLSDAARKEMQTVLSPSATVGQLKSALKVLKAESRNREQSLQSELDAIRKRIKGGPKSREKPADLVFNPATGQFEQP